MANPPYSGSVIILRENQDGIDVSVYHWDDVAAGTPIPPSPQGLINALFRSLPAVSYHAERMCPTRADLKTKFGQYVDNKFPDTA